MQPTYRRNICFHVGPGLMTFSESIYCHFSDYIRILSCPSQREMVQHPRECSQQLDASKRTFQSEVALGKRKLLFFFFLKLHGLITFICWNWKSNRASSALCGSIRRRRRIYLIVIVIDAITRCYDASCFQKSICCLLLHCLHLL